MEDKIVENKIVEEVVEKIVEKVIEEVETSSSNKVEKVSIVFVMDSSGSMSNMGNEPLQGLNSFYKQQKDSGEFTSTLVFFSNKVTFHHQNLSGKDVPIISTSDYVPAGMTALYDAIGESIELQKSQKTENVVFVILTDGHENASHKYKRNEIKNLIEEMEKEHKWVFIYLGANQDSFAVGNSIGIRHSADYEYSPMGCLNIMRTVSDTVSRCVSHDVRAENFTGEELKASSIRTENENSQNIHSLNSTVQNVTLPNPLILTVPEPTILRRS